MEIEHMNSCLATSFLDIVKFELEFGYNGAMIEVFKLKGIAKAVVNILVGSNIGSPKKDNTVTRKSRFN